MSKELVIELEDETIEIWRHGVNDYSANFLQNDFSVRGTLPEVLRDITNNFGIDAVLA